jgi:EpsI family protein
MPLREPGQSFTRRALLVLLFFGFQAAAVRWMAGVERPPAMPDLSKFPSNLGEWTKAVDEPLEPSVVAQLGVDRYLNANYGHTGNDFYGNVFVAWFQSQRGGATQPHSPQVCLPGSGWIPLATAEIPLRTAIGTIDINRYTVIKGQERAVILYWYETPRRVMASEWAAKLWLIPDSIRDHRTDTSLVRVVVWNRDRSDNDTSQAAEELARRVYPQVRNILPTL